MIAFPKTPQSPQLPRADGLEAATVASFATEALLERTRVTGGDATAVQAWNVHIEESLLQKVVLNSARMEKMSLSDSLLRSCDLSAARCSEGSIIRVQFSGGRLTGIDLSRSTIKDVVFEGCKLDMANFRFAKLTRVRFVDCLLGEADFQNAVLQDVVFEASYLDRTELSNVAAKRVDMRSSQLLDIRGWPSLKGTIVDTAQLAAIAPQLALAFGLIVEE